MTTPPTVNVTIAAELRAAFARKNLSRREVALKIGVSHMWVQRRLAGDQPLSVDDVVRICTAIDADPMPLLERALTPVA
jgi:transcriptional regulator with XRE-family HTH domain